ncbi:MAG TPA: pectate lyase [Anaerolineae bacterium]|nr:pectate lyase [Anaerolineae bacterium]
MVRLDRSLVVCLIVFLIRVFISCQSEAQPKNQEVLDAMKKATDFMMNTVSNRGGFVHQYSSDLSEQWGEIPARKTMIWVQDPGTVGVGMMLLNAYKTTGNTEYLKFAEKTANALIWGQHPSGGWHYFIDFDMAGVQKWYDDVFSKCWGWEEYYHYYGNCTFDDNVSTGATRFLMELYMTTLDPQYRVPLIKAINFILESQYPNGAWPQRYPLMYDYPHDGHPDYTSYYTLNDEVIQGNIYFLLDTYDKLGNEEYKKAAYRGMDFLYIAQLPSPQAGWGQQYDLDMNSAAARSYEPASVMPGYTVQVIRDLMEFYKITGNRKYLRGIPDAIEWLENSYLPKDHKMNDRVTHATFYELGTNRPLYAHREGTTIENGRYWVDYDPRNLLGHYGGQTTINVQAIKKEYERINSLEPDAAVQAYHLKKVLPSPVPKIDPETVKTIISSLDKRGAWVEEMRIPDYIDLIHNPPRKLMGINAQT